MFDTSGQTNLNVMLGDKAIEYPPTGQPVTYTYKGEDLVSETESAIYGHISLIHLATDGTTQSSVIVDWREEFVYFLDKAGNYRVCPATILNQGGLVAIGWDPTESDRFDGKDEGLIMDKLTEWFMVTDPDQVSRYRIIALNLGKLR